MRLCGIDLHCKKKKKVTFEQLFFFFFFFYSAVKNQKLRELKRLRQPASADFWVLSTFSCINLKQQVEKAQKSAEAGCLKLLILLNFFFLQCTVFTMAHAV